MKAGLQERTVCSVQGGWGPSGSWHTAQSKGSSGNRQEGVDVSEYQGRLSGPKGCLNVCRESPRKGKGYR